MSRRGKLSTMLFTAVLSCLFSIASDHCNASIVRETPEWWIANNGVFELKISKETAEIKSAKLLGSDVELKAELSIHSFFFPEFEFQYDASSWAGVFNPYRNGFVKISVPYNSDVCAIMKVSYLTGFIDIFWEFKFLKDNPYFIATTERLVKQSLVYNNAQQCAMFTVEMDDSYIVTYENEFVQNMDNGLKIPVYPEIPSESSVTAQHSMFTAIDHGLGARFPALAWHDRDHELTVGVLVTDVSPNQRKTISHHGGGRSVAVGYCEAQWNLFGKADDESIYLKEGTRYGMEMYYYLNDDSADELDWLQGPTANTQRYDGAEEFDRFNRALFNETHYDPAEIEPYYAASWGGRAGASPSYVWAFPQASNNWICTTELFRHRAISIPSSQNGQRNCHILDFFVRSKNQHGAINLTSTDPGEQILAETEDAGSYMVGTMGWSFGNLTHTLSYKMFEDSDRLIVSGTIQPESDVNLGELFVELVYSLRVMEVTRINEDTWDVRCEDSVYGTIGMTIYDPEGIERIQNTGKSLRLYVLDNPNDRMYTPQAKWDYCFYIFPHTSVSVEEESDIPPLHTAPTEYYRKYYKILPGCETLDALGMEPNRKILVCEAVPEPRAGTIVEIEMYAEQGTYPVRFFFGNQHVEGLRKNGLTVPEDAWRYDEETEVLTMDSYWDGLTFLEVFSTKSALNASETSDFLGLVLKSNFPNPFREKTAIPFWVPARSTVRISICDVTGRRVRKLLNSNVEGGKNVVTWDARGGHGEKMASGIYFYTVYSEWGSVTGKMLLLQ